VSYRFSYWKTEFEDRYIELVQRAQMSGEVLWAIKFDQAVFNRRTRHWVYEPLPSSRTDEFLADTRMTLDEARKIIPREIYYAHHHARRRVARIIRVRHWKQEQNARKAAMQEVVNLLAARTIQEDPA
jgi:hypothetical protein